MEAQSAVHRPACRRGWHALGANLMPPREPKPATSYDASTYRAVDFPARLSSGSMPIFVLGGAKQKIDASQAAPDLAVARRLALGLMGTVPSLEEIRQFEYLPDNERLPWWIDHILQDRRSADYLAERLARACVGTEGGPFIFFRRRRFVEWLGDQVANNRPYDQIVRDLITSDGLWTDKPATNFITVTSKPDKKNQPDPIRLAGRVTRAFLGLRLDCAECHNHPFADWKQADFRGLAAFFGQTQVGFTGIHEGAGEFVRRRTRNRSRTKRTEYSPSVACPSPPELLPNPADGFNRRQPGTPRRLGFSTGSEKSLLRPRRRQPRLGADAGPAARRAGGQSRIRRPCRPPRPWRSWRRTSPRTGSTSGG